jgi:tetratricopeptide (TPR) repeat protein
VFSARFLHKISKYQRPEEARRFLRNDRYWIPEIAERVLSRADELSPKKPRHALGFAEIGETLVERIRGATPDLRMHALCSVGGALRATGELVRADLTFARAEALATSCSIPLRAMLVRQTAILRMHQGRPDDALRLIDQAVALDRSARGVPAKSLSAKGSIHYFRAEYDRSRACFKEVLDGTDPTSDLYTFVMQNLAATYAGQPNLTIQDAVFARKLLRDVQEQIKGVRETPVRYIMWHTEGLFHGLLEEFYKAILHLVQAQEGFLRIKQIGDFARVSLDLIDVHLRKGDPGKAKTTIERAAKEIAGVPGYEETAALFERSLEVPITQAVGFLRERLSGALALRVEMPGEG